jgi:flagellar biosynthesis protein FlhF
MSVKRFVAPDMRHALSRVGKEMGPDAVVLSSRSLPEGGVEVLATVSGIEDSAAGEDKGPTTGSRSPSRDDVRSQMLRKQLDGLRDAANRQSIAGKRAAKSSSDAVVKEFVRASQEVGQMRSELHGLRSLLQQRLDAMAWDEFSQRTPVQAVIWEQLNDLGIPGYLCREVLSRVRPEYDVAQAWRFALAYLKRAVPVAADDAAAAGGMFALVGPTGVGKTTTIGKLATRHVLQHGAESLALVTTDSYRIASHEQLRTLGGILGAGVHVVDQRRSLAETLDALGHKSLVLIDTAGMHPSDPALKHQLDVLAAETRVRKLLVLACTSQGKVMSTAWRSYSRADLYACVLSKLDEAGSLGEALALIIDRKLPVAYEGFGQAIPDDLKVADSQSLLNRAVALAGDGTESVASGADRDRLIKEFSTVRAVEDNRASAVAAG